MLATMNIEQIPPQHLHTVWPLVSDWLAAALVHSGGEYNIDQLKLMLSRGEQCLHVFLNDDEKPVGALTVSFENHPNARIAFITAIGGRGLSNETFLAQFCDWCRGMGCTHIRGASHPSAAQWAKIFGFKQRYIIVEHTL